MISQKIEAPAQAPQTPEDAAEGPAVPAEEPGKQEEPAKPQEPDDGQTPPQP